MLVVAKWWWWWWWLLCCCIIFCLYFPYKLHTTCCVCLCLLHFIPNYNSIGQMETVHTAYYVYIMYKCIKCWKISCWFLLISPRVYFHHDGNWRGYLATSKNYQWRLHNPSSLNITEFLLSTVPVSDCQIFQMFSPITSPYFPLACCPHAQFQKWLMTIVMNDYLYTYFYRIFSLLIMYLALASRNGWSMDYSFHINLKGCRIKGWRGGNMIIAAIHTTRHFGHLAYSENYLICLCVDFVVYLLVWLLLLESPDWSYSILVLYSTCAEHQNELSIFLFFFFKSFSFILPWINNYSNTAAALKSYPYPDICSSCCRYKPKLLDIKK